MTVIYRAPTADDIAALADLGRETFCDTFAHLYNEDDLATFLGQVYTPEAVKADMDNPLRRYSVAEENGLLVGYCKIANEVTLDHDPKTRKIIELKQLYIRKSHFGTGIADQFMQWAEEQAHLWGADDILLSVFSENYRAQRFYARHGFAHIADTIFMVGNQEDHEFLYLKKLK